MLAIVTVATVFGVQAVVMVATELKLAARTGANAAARHTGGNAHRSGQHPRGRTNSGIVEIAQIADTVIPACFRISGAGLSEIGPVGGTLIVLELTQTRLRFRNRIFQ